jgi:hypothetical protein
VRFKYQGLYWIKVDGKWLVASLEEFCEGGTEPWVFVDFGGHSHHAPERIGAPVVLPDRRGIDPFYDPAFPTLRLSARYRNYVRALRAKGKA